MPLTRPISVEIGNLLDYKMTLLRENIETTPVKDFPCVTLPWDEATFTSLTSTDPEVPYNTFTWHVLGGENGLFITTTMGNLQYKVALVLSDSGLVEHYAIIDGVMVDTYSKEENELASLAAIEPVLMAISFLHTKKGASLENAAPLSRQVRRANNRKGYPAYEYKVLNVPSISKVVSHARESVKTGTRMHLVRGHWADHREHGICNNPNARDIYWIPPHTRGDKSIGVLDKDYALVA